MQEKNTHFGYQDVSPDEKTEKVSAVFDSVASKYDVMNDAMSFGLHRVWKHQFVYLANVRPNFKVLDLAAGTADISALLATKLGEQGEITLCDLNLTMLEYGRGKLVDRGLLKNLHYVQAMAEALPFRENYFDRVVVAFGLRNFTDKSQALQAIFRVLKPGGQLLILEFSKPRKWLRKAYDFYSFEFLPKMGKVVTSDASSYRYLAESIRKHPDQATLQIMLESVGFQQCDYLDLNFGIVCIHRGYKLSA